MTPGVTHDMSILSLITGASVLVQAVMLILLLASVFSWYYIFLKYFALRRATALAGSPVDAVVASPMRRTRETAGIVGAVLGLDVEVDEDLRECAFGLWEGLTFAQAEEGWPDEVTDWLSSTAVAPPGGESFDAVAERVVAARDRLLARHKGATVLVVSHVTPIKTLVRLALDAPSHALYRMELAPASLTAVSWFGDGNASLRLFNDTGHLDLLGSAAPPMHG